MQKRIQNPLEHLRCSFLRQYLKAVNIFSKSSIFDIRQGYECTSALQMPSRGVLKERCSKHLQQVYRRTPMPKCNFDKVLKQNNLIEITFRHRYSSVNLLHIFRTFLRAPLDSCFWKGLIGLSLFLAEASEKIVYLKVLEYWMLLQVSPFSLLLWFMFDPELHKWEDTSSNFLKCGN